MIVNLVEQHAPSSQVCMALRAARAAQRLQMPIKPSTHQIFKTQLDGSSDDRLMGTPDQWLGVPPSSLLSALSSVKDQTMVLDNVKTKLDEWMARISLMLLGSTPKKQGTEQQQKSLTEVILDRKASIQSKKIRALILTKSILRDTIDLLHLHKAITEQCLAFAQDALITRQPRLDQTNIDYDISWTKVMEAKLMAMEAQMELQTYGNPPHLLALAKVHKLISESREKVEEVTAQVVMKLNCYEALGPAFESVASEYGRVLKQLHETQAMIARFKEMETDLNHESQESMV